MSRRHEALTTVLVLATGGIIGFVFVHRFTAVQLVLGRLIAPAATALLAAAASIGCGAATLRFGRWLVTRAGASNEGVQVADPAEELLIGVAVFGTGLSLMALAGLLSPAALLTATLLAGAFGIAIRWRQAASLAGALSIGRAAILLPPLAVAIAAAIAPVNTPDELVYKLAVPRIWLLFGRMVELPLNSNSYFPASIYMADLAAMIGGGVGAKLLHLLLYLATLRVVYRLSARISGADTLWPAAVLAWTPALAIIAGWAWAEWAMIGLLLLSVQRFHGFLDSGRAHDLAASAAALGAALSAKYTALPWLAVFLAVACWRFRGMRNAVRLLAAAALLVMLVGGLFYVRNAIWTGSPLAPFFLPGSPRVENFRSEAGGVRELLLGYDIFHEGIIDDSLGIVLPALVLISPLSLMALTPLTADLFLLGAGQLAFLIPLAPTSRLILLGLAPLALLGAITTWRLHTTSTRTVRIGLNVLAGGAFTAQLLLVLYVFVTSWQFLPYLVGAESEQAYLKRTRDYWGAYGWIGEHTQADAKLLLLGENRTFHLDRRAIAQGNLDGPRMAAYLSQSRTPEALAAEWRRERFTHVLVHKPWFRVAGSSAPLRMLEREYVLELPADVDAVVRGCLAAHAKAVYSDRAYILFELTP